MKRFLILILVSIFALANCGKRSGKGKVAIRWSADQNPIRQKQIKLFEKAYPNIKIKFEWIQAKDEQSKILTQTIGGDPPDVFMVHSLPIFMTFANKGILLDLTDLIKKNEIDMKDFWKELDPYIYFKNTPYGFPDNITPLVVYYNKDIFDKWGVSYPDKNWTWNDLLEKAKKMTKKEGQEYSSFGFEIPEYLIDIFLRMHGGSFYTKGFKKCNLNSPASKKGIQFWYDMMYEHQVMPTPAQADSIASASSFADFFAAGKIAMHICGRWKVITYREAIDLDYGIAPLPKDAKNLVLSHTTCISKNTKHPEEAFKFLSFLISQENGLLVAETGDGVPSMKSIAKSKEFLSLNNHPDEKYISLFNDSIKGQKVMEVYPDPDVSQLELNSIWYRYFDKIKTKNATVDEGLNQAAEEINKLLREAQKK